MNELSGKRVLLGVTGGIAAYKSADLVRLLRKQGAEVRVVMTVAAREFVTPLTFQALSGYPVHTDLLDTGAEAAMGHIELARWADVLLIAPATADFIARLVSGRANDLLSAVCLACDATVAIAPAMNRVMWNSPATRDNINTLKNRAVRVLGPAEGEQACGESGPGRMLEPAELVSLINQFLEGQTERILDQGGYLDKYIGDAVMAVFGSPEPLDNHALQACKAALACRIALHELNDEIESTYGMRLGMRTGVNTGDVVVGNVGSTHKRNYTVLGDAVNLASRLEGANKQTGTSILLGPLTAKSVAGEMVLRPVARLQVKGKTQAVEVFELMAERSGCDAASIRFSELFAAGFAAYCEQNFSGAAMLFKQAMELRPGDLLSVHYLDEAGKYEARPPEPDWHGVLKLETK